MAPRRTKTDEQECLAENRRLARNGRELLKLILKDATLEKLTLDIQRDDLKKMIQKKKFELEALRILQSVEKR